VQSETFASAVDLLGRDLRDARGCILLDIKMPGTNGVELQARLADSGVRLPILFLSAHADVPLAVRVMKAGALDVVTKPFKASDLLNAVQRALSSDAASYQQSCESREVRQRFESLTQREQTVMRLIVTGLRNKEVASQLGTSIKTVKIHRSRVMSKMGVASFAELVAVSFHLGLPTAHSQEMPLVQ
jgi:FixJ family two-component response regulator